MCYSYYLGLHNKVDINDVLLIQSEVKKMIENNMCNTYNKNKCLIISKVFYTYGGVQNTTKQLIETTDIQYITKVIIPIKKNYEVLYNENIYEKTSMIPNYMIKFIYNYKKMVEQNHGSLDFSAITKFNK